jgi:hypothetical protein
MFWGELPRCTGSSLGHPEMRSHNIPAYSPLPLLQAHVSGHHAIGEALHPGLVLGLLSQYPALKVGGRQRQSPLVVPPIPRTVGQAPRRNIG